MSAEDRSRERLGRVAGAECHIGTSGWHYRHWRGSFYPPEVRAQDYLAVYADAFESVEVNSTFYRLPSEAAVASWVAGTPPGFLFACKGSRFITHMKKLKDPQDSLAPFLERLRAFGPRLGPLVFQLPPRWQPNPERLEAFLQALPVGQRVALELRDPRWHRPDILHRLADRNCAFCLFELGGARSPIEVTADFVYVRLHGPHAPYRGSYSRAALATWAERIAHWRDAGLDVYCYFDNDEQGYAPRNAQSLIRMLGGRPERRAGESARGGNASS